MTETIIWRLNIGVNTAGHKVPQIVAQEDQYQQNNITADRVKAVISYVHCKKRREKQTIGDVSIH